MTTGKMSGLGMMALCAGAAGFTVAPAQAGSITLSTIVGPGGTPGNTSKTASQLVGTLSWDVLANGDVKVTLLQYINDNTYGTNVNTAMWGSKAHKFGDITGSDEAEFRFTDSKGTVVLDFKADYFSQDKSYASGYGTSGLGGDGSGTPIVGSAANIVSINTTMSDNFSLPAVIANPSAYTTNSPANPAAIGWNTTNGYTIVVKAATFGANGFGDVTVPEVHDSPAANFRAPAVPLPPAVWSGLAMMGTLAGLSLSRRVRHSSLHETT